MRGAAYLVVMAGIALVFTAAVFLLAFVLFRT